MPSEYLTWEKLFALTTLMVLFASCSWIQKAQREPPEMFQPCYQGSVIPISIPVEITYHPAEFSFQVWTVEKVELAESDICELFFIGRSMDKTACAAHVRGFGDNLETASEERTTKGNARIWHSGKHLVWNIDTLEVTADGQQWRPTLPINRVRVVSDSHGRAKEVEITFPALQAAGARNTPEPGTRVYEQVVNLFKQSLLPLPDKSISTGDNLYSLPVAEMVAEMLSFWGEQDKNQVSAAIEAKKDNLNYRVAGWSDFEDEKVLLAEVNYIGSVKIHGKTMQIENAGYVLLDADKGHVVQRENSSVMKYGKSQFRTLYKIVAEPREHQ